MYNAVQITQREQQIWTLIAKGMTKKEVANHIDRSFHTVNQIVRNIYDKLDIRKETDLVREWFFYQSLVTREEFSEAIKTKGISIVLGFLLLTSIQVVFDSPAVRIVRPTASRSVNRAPSGRRKSDYYV